jgi:hypothetical protein
MIKDDEFSMHKTLKLALKGRDMTYPNPLVGCIIVQDNQVISKVYHKKAGKNHAERVAILSAPKKHGNIPHGSIQCCILEPCVHRGATFEYNFCNLLVEGSSGEKHLNMLRRLTIPSIAKTKKLKRYSIKVSGDDTYISYKNIEVCG